VEISRAIKYPPSFLPATQHYIENWSGPESMTYSKPGSGQAPTATCSNGFRLCRPITMVEQGSLASGPTRSRQNKDRVCGEDRWRRVLLSCLDSCKSTETNCYNLVLTSYWGFQAPYSVKQYTRRPKPASKLGSLADKTDLKPIAIFFLLFALGST
jgi:hypothetical protein